MPINGLSVGRDFTFGFYDQNTGNLLQMGDIQSLKVTQQVANIKSMPYDGPPKYGHVPDGWKGTFTIVRTGSQLEDLQLALNAAFENGTPIKAGYISETVNNPDGTVSRYQYTGVDFHMTDVGDVARDKTVVQTVEFMASTKVQLA